MSHARSPRLALVLGAALLACSGGSPSEQPSRAAPTVAEALVDAPELEIDAAGACVERADCADAGALPSCASLEAALTKRRDAWIAAHPGRAFPGVISVKADPRATAALVKCALSAAARAGYADAELEVSRDRGGARR